MQFQRIVRHCRQKACRRRLAGISRGRDGDIDAVVVDSQSADRRAVIADGVIDRPVLRIGIPGKERVVANDVSRTSTGFDSNQNAGWFITANDTVEIPTTSKPRMATLILNQALKLRTARVAAS